VEIVSDTNFRE